MSYQIGTKVFGDWEIVRKIGEGASGEVFEIQKEGYGIKTKSALKIICVPKTKEELYAAYNEGMDEMSTTSFFRELVNEIVREIAVLTELKGHPGIVGYEDHSVIPHEDSVGWDILIRMELLESLQEYQTKHEMNQETVLRMALELSDALMYCEKHNLIHRDIKPQNIFVNQMGQFKLGDFGVARTMEKTIGVMSRTGTEGYMAPEVYKGQEYGANVDIYSLGMVLYRCLNDNRFPFVPLPPNRVTFHDYETALIRRMQGEKLPPPVHANSCLAEIILKACSYDSTERYSSAEEMKKEIQHVMNRDVYDEKDIKTIRLTRGGIAPTYIDDSITSGRQSPLTPTSKKKIPWLLIIFSILIVGVAGSWGSYVVLQQGKDAASEKVLIPTDIPTIAPTATPTIAPTATPAIPPTVTSIATPTIASMPVVEMYGELISSNRIVEYNGWKYTTYNILREGWTSISGSYVDTMLIYDDHIYWRKTTELGHFQCEIIRMDLDCSNQVVLTKYADSYKPFYVYDGFLYYTHLGENGNEDTRSSRKINLETLEEINNLPYYIVMGNENIWFSSDLAQSALFSSLPGHQEIVKTPGVRGTKLGVNGTKLFYVYKDDIGFSTKAYDGKTGGTEIFLQNQSSKSVLAGDALYYKEVNEGYTSLYRWDLQTNDIRRYDLGKFNLYMGGGFYEVDGKVYFIQFRPENGSDNTEFWELNLNTTERTMIATWYNSNAENASKEP